MDLLKMFQRGPNRFRRAKMALCTYVGMCFIFVCMCFYCSYVGKVGATPKLLSLGIKKDG